MFEIQEPFACMQLFYSVRVWCE